MLPRVLSLCGSNDVTFLYLGYVKRVHPLMRLTIAVLLLMPLWLSAQVQDNFTDGDFTANPIWSGEVSTFEASANRLHLNAPAVASSSYLSTASSAIHNASWEFYVEMGFATSNTSLTRVYLVSDQQDLKQALNGYFVMIGNTPDEVSLYRQTRNSKLPRLLTAKIHALAHPPYQ